MQNTEQLKHKMGALDCVITPHKLNIAPKGKNLINIY